MNKALNSAIDPQLSTPIKLGSGIIHIGLMILFVRNSATVQVGHRADSAQPVLW